MHYARFCLPIFIALAAAGCARQQQQQAYIIDPATGRSVPVVMQQQPSPPQYAQASYQPPAPQASASSDRGLFNSRQSAPQAYAQQPQYVRPSVPPPVAQSAPSGERGLVTSQQAGPRSYLLQPATPSYAAQNPAPVYAAPATGGPYVPVPNGGFAAASLY